MLSLAHLFVVYKLRCSERTLYISMRKCIRTYGGVEHCFPRLYGRGLIGKRHQYKKYGHGFGLGVKFVRKGIVYENYCEYEQINYIILVFTDLHGRLVFVDI